MKNILIIYRGERLNYIEFVLTSYVWNHFAAEETLKNLALATESIPVGPLQSELKRVDINFCGLCASFSISSLLFAASEHRTHHYNPTSHVDPLRKEKTLRPFGHLISITEKSACFAGHRPWEGTVPLCAILNCKACKSDIFKTVLQPICRSKQSIASG